MGAIHCRVREGGDTCCLSVAHVVAVELSQLICSVLHAPRGRSIPQPTVSPNSRGPWNIPQHGPRAQIVSKMSISQDAVASFLDGLALELSVNLYLIWELLRVAAPGPGGAPTWHPIINVPVGSGFLCPVVVGLQPAPSAHSCENSNMSSFGNGFSSN